MKRHSGLVAGVVLCSVGLFAGCAQSVPGGGARPMAVADQTSAGPVDTPVTDHLVFDIGVESTPVVHSIADWSVPVGSPAAMREFAWAAFAGTVIAVEGSFVDPDGGIATTYTVRVDTVYKGEDLPQTISVALPGGTVPLGAYIDGLDSIGRYEMKLGLKDPAVFPGASTEDPRTMDPTLPITENRGTNPTSASLLERVQPDAWVFFIGPLEGDVHYGAAWDHALGYLRDGMVYGLHPETVDSPTPESALLAG